MAAAPTLKEALRRYRSEPLELDWLSFSYDIVAMDMWDDEAWFELAAGQLRLARANGDEELCEASYLAGCDGAHSKDENQRGEWGVMHFKNHIN